jgi:hypothetical protein
MRQLSLLLMAWLSLWNGTLAQEAPEDYPQMFERSVESRVRVPEPEIFSPSYRPRTLGVYFGVGFRSLDFTLADGQNRTFSDGTSNGVAFHLGYLQRGQAFEFERQISLVGLSKPVAYKSKEFDALEVVQNRLWYWWVERLSPDWLAFYGSGLEFAQMRPSSADTELAYVDETSAIFGGGISVFAVPSLLLGYRFATGFHLSTLGLSTHEPLLIRSQIHSFYLDYFFPL